MSQSRPAPKKSDQQTSPSVAKFTVIGENNRSTSTNSNVSKNTSFADAKSQIIRGPGHCSN